MLSNKVKISSENEFKVLIENFKIAKQLKEKLIVFRVQKDKAFNSLQKDICNLKKKYTEKSLVFEQGWLN